MENRTRTILAVVAILVTLFFIFRMKEMYKGEAGPSAGPTPEEEVEENPEVKKIVEEKGITQEDLDALAGLL